MFYHIISRFVVSLSHLVSKKLLYILVVSISQVSQQTYRTNIRLYISFGTIFKIEDPPFPLNKTTRDTIILLSSKNCTEKHKKGSETLVSVVHPSPTA